MFRVGRGSVDCVGKMSAKKKARTSATESPKLEGVSDNFKKRVLELFEKFSTREYTIPTHLKKIRGEKGFGPFLTYGDKGFHLTYECTKFFENYKNQSFEGIDKEYLESTLDNGAWESLFVRLFDKYKNNIGSFFSFQEWEEEYLKKVESENYFDHSFADLRMEGDIFDGEECILKWSCRSDYNEAFGEEIFGTRKEFYNNLKVSYSYPNGKFGDFEDWNKGGKILCERRCIDPDFILEEIWRPLLAAFGGVDNINCERDCDYHNGDVKTNRWLAKRFLEKRRVETNLHKRKAWEKIANSIYNCDENIKSVQDAKNIEGLGKNSLAFMEELLEIRKSSCVWKEKMGERMKLRESSDKKINAWIVRKFKEKAERETNPRKKKALENAGAAIEGIHSTIRSVDDVKHVKGIEKSLFVFVEGLFKNSGNGEGGGVKTLISLDEEKQAQLLKGRASPLDAEVTVEKKTRELLEPALVPANTHLLKVFYENASSKDMESHEKKAYLNAGFAIKACEYEITSGAEAMKLKYVSKLAAEIVEKALNENRDKVAEIFFDDVEKGSAFLGATGATTQNQRMWLNLVEGDIKDISKAYAALCADAQIGIDENGMLRVNGRSRENFHAKGCPFEWNNWIVDGTGEYDGFSDPYAGLIFSGTLTNVKSKKERYSFSFEYKHLGGNGCEEYDIFECGGNFEEEDIICVAREIVANYDFGYYEYRSTQKL